MVEVSIKQEITQNLGPAQFFQSNVLQSWSVFAHVLTQEFQLRVSELGLFVVHIEWSAFLRALN